MKICRGRPHDRHGWLLGRGAVGACLAVYRIALAALAQTDDLETVRLAAEEGDAAAQFTLGVMYSTGRGVPQDAAEAVRWYRLAAAQGHATAQFNLGVMSRTGRGVPPDDAEAVRWYRLAAAQGNTEAQVSLGSMYAEGLGVPQDHVSAHMWFNVAAALSTGEARERYAKARDTVAESMTREERSEAQRRAREWAPE